MAIATHTYLFRFSMAHFDMKPNRPLVSELLPTDLRMLHLQAAGCGASDTEDDDDDDQEDFSPAGEEVMPPYVPLPPGLHRRMDEEVKLDLSSSEANDCRDDRLYLDEKTMKACASWFFLIVFVAACRIVLLQTHVNCVGCPTMDCQMQSQVIQLHDSKPPVTWFCRRLSDT